VLLYVFSKLHENQLVSYDCGQRPDVCKILLHKMMDHLAPPFKGIAVQDSLFKEVSLNHFKGKYLVMLFYPLDFNEVCPSMLPHIPTDAVNLSRHLQDFHDLNCEVMGVSTDSHYVHLAFSRLDREFAGLGSSKMYLYADNDNTVSKAYGFLKEDEGLAFNGIVLLNRDSEVKHVMINDFPVEFDVEEVIRIIFAVQAVEKSDYTQCTPVNWKPNEAVIELTGG
jgi:alkyl hydroperoxide reductase subunit AhpC